MIDCCSTKVLLILRIIWNTYVDNFKGWRIENWKEEIGSLMTLTPFLEKVKIVWNQKKPRIQRLGHEPGLLGLNALIETFLHVFKLKASQVEGKHTLNFVSWNWPLYDLWVFMEQNLYDIMYCNLRPTRTPPPSPKAWLIKWDLWWWWRFSVLTRSEIWSNLRRILRVPKKLLASGLIKLFKDCRLIQKSETGSNKKQKTIQKISFVLISDRKWNCDQQSV